MNLFGKIKTTVCRWITQRRIAQLLGIEHTSEVRDLIHSMRMKGWWVLSSTSGMAKTSSSKLRDAQAEALIARAKEIISVAEGLMRKDREELSPIEERLWELLPEINEVIETYDSSEAFPYMEVKDAN